MKARLVASHQVPHGKFGKYVDIDNDTVLAGDPALEVACIFMPNGTSWNEEAELAAPDSNTTAFGASVVLEKDTVVIGINGTGSGYIFRHNGTSWSQEAKLAASNGEEDGKFGFDKSVALDGGVIAIGAYDDNVGNVKRAG